MRIIKEIEISLNQYRGKGSTSQYVDYGGFVAGEQAVLVEFCKNGLAQGLRRSFYTRTHLLVGCKTIHTGSVGYRDHVRPTGRTGWPGL